MNSFNLKLKLLISLLTLVCFKINAGAISQSYKGLKAAFKKSTITITPSQSVDFSKELEKYKLSREEIFRVERMVSHGVSPEIAIGMTETGKRANAEKQALRNINYFYSDLNGLEKVIQVNKTLQLAYEFQRVLGLIEPMAVYNISSDFRAYSLTPEKLLKGLRQKYKERLESYITRINETSLRFIPSFHWEKLKSNLVVSEAKICNKVQLGFVERVAKKEVSKRIEEFITGINSPSGRNTSDSEKVWYLPLHSEILTHQLNTEYKALEKLAKEKLFGEQLVKLYETVEQPFGPVKIEWSSIEYGSQPEIKVEIPLHCGINYSFKVSVEENGEVKESIPFVLDSFNMPILTPQVNKMITSIK